MEGEDNMEALVMSDMNFSAFFIYKYRCNAFCISMLMKLALLWKVYHIRNFIGFKFMEINDIFKVQEM